MVFLFLFNVFLIFEWDLGVFFLVGNVFCVRFVDVVWMLLCLFVDWFSVGWCGFGWVLLLCGWWDIEGLDVECIMEVDFIEGFLFRGGENIVIFIFIRLEFCNFFCFRIRVCFFFLIFFLIVNVGISMLVFEYFFLFVLVFVFSFWLSKWRLFFKVFFFFMLIILSIGFLCRIGLGKFFGWVEFLFFCFLLIFFYCWSLEMFLRREIFLIFFIVIILGLECCICGIGV